MRWWGVLLVAYFVGVAWGADTDETTLPYLKNHPEDWPRQLVLKEPVIFKLLVNGKEAGSMTMNPLSSVVLVSVAEDKVQISNGTSTTLITPEQSNLWDLVAAIRKERESRPDPARDDPATKLALPTNSESAEWYKKQLDGAIDPWLSKYPTHKLAAAMKERKAAFEAEAARVAAGEVRRGERWIGGAEAIVRRIEFAVEDLQTHLQECVASRDVARLQSLLAEVEKFGKSPIHPRLHRVAVAVIDAVQAALTDENAKRPLADWLKKFPRELADAEDKIIDQLQTVPKLDPAAAAAALAEVEKAWPGNEISKPLYLGLEAKIITQINADVAANKIAAASRLGTLLEQLLRLPAPASPQLEEMKKTAAILIPALSLARSVETLVEREEYEPAMKTDFSKTPPAFQKWYEAFKSKLIARQEDSSKAISQAEHELIHLRFSAAQAEFQKAKDLWPENPEIPPRERAINVAYWAGILIGIILGLSLLSYLYSVWDHYRFKRVLKRKAAEAQNQPREW